MLWILQGPSPHPGLSPPAARRVQGQPQGARGLLGSSAPSRQVWPVGRGYGGEAMGAGKPGGRAGYLRCTRPPHARDRSEAPGAGTPGSPPPGPLCPQGPRRRCRAPATGSPHLRPRPLWPHPLGPGRRRLPPVAMGTRPPGRVGGGWADRREAAAGAAPGTRAVGTSPTGRGRAVPQFHACSLDRGLPRPRSKSFPAGGSRCWPGRHPARVGEVC